jgi:formylglycine-generating enzyme
LSEGWQMEEDTLGTGGMYAQFVGENPDYTSLINDNARVYKGGSWRDRAYWLSPATRRFLDQESARPDLGFRCAMIRVGSPGGF